MKTYIFNRDEFSWGEEYYDLIKDKMSLPAWFGKNADALWDMLTGYIELPCKIVLIGFDRKENDYNAHIINLINNCFKKAEKESNGKIEVVEK